MKIKITKERDCCQQEDLKPIEGTPLFSGIPEYVFCVHCGRQLHHHSFTDPAGSSDWEYRRIPRPWEQVDMYGAKILVP